ncbi:MAG: hypothetical protein WA776_13940 [Xanthobacteraceae bacterium]
MTAGRTLFWLSTLFAGIAVLWVISDVFYGMGTDYPPTLDVTGIVSAALIWGAGWLCWLAL